MPSCSNPAVREQRMGNAESDGVWEVASPQLPDKVVGGEGTEDI
jgi:hypothetical protein